MHCNFSSSLFFFNVAQCTDLCSGHGVVEHGQCRCQEGWHGAECQLMSHQCEVPNCNQRGSCVSGQCICQTGYQGKFCEQGMKIEILEIKRNEKLIYYF